MKVTPVENHILVKVENSEDKTQGGIIIPQGEGDFPMGEIVAMGPRMTTRSLENEVEIKVGDKVIFNGGLGEVVSEGKPLIVIKRCHVVAVVED